MKTSYSNQLADIIEMRLEKLSTNKWLNVCLYLDPRYNVLQSEKNSLLAKNYIRSLIQRSEDKIESIPNIDINTNDDYSNDDFDSTIDKMKKVKKSKITKIGIEYEFEILRK